VDIKRRVEERSDRSFNSLLLNYYRDGKDSMGWHADDETELGENPVVPSISLGATRKFLIRHRRSRESKAYLLTHGSLLLMGGTMQHHWLHAVPKTARPIGERINLTFRHILEAPALASPTKTGPSPA
jgi:alkylated DNA repair dioxygenase AlkB